MGGSTILSPAERMALLVATAQVERGESPTPNVAAVVVAALIRLAGEGKADASDDRIVGVE